MVNYRSQQESDEELLNLNSAVGFKLPSAGVAPAPGIMKKKMRDFVPVLKVKGGRGVSRLVLPVSFNAVAFFSL